MSTVIVFAVLMVIMGFAVRYILKGKASCTGNCTGCSSCTQGSDLYEAYKHGELSK